MYLSCLDLDPDPTRRLTRLWLSNPYRIHQRLCLAFREPGRVLFRLEERPNLRLLVQSPGEPDWQLAFADHPVLSAPPRSKPFRPALVVGQRLRFSLRANPTVKRDGSRHGLFKEDAQIAWLHRKGEQGGFQPLSVQARGGTVQVSCKSRHHDEGLQRHYAVEFNGLLQIIDVDRFITTLGNGIGSGKAYGFGLLTIAPAP
jgi:CRISPR system Cascade subunit CasE